MRTGISKTALMDASLSAQRASKSALVVKGMNQAAWPMGKRAPDEVTLIVPSPVSSSAQFTSS